MFNHEPKADFTYDNSVRPPKISFYAAEGADSSNVYLETDGSRQITIATGLLPDSNGICTFDYTLTYGTSNVLSRGSDIGGHEPPPNANDQTTIVVAS